MLTLPTSSLLNLDSEAGSSVSLKATAQTAKDQRGLFQVRLLSAGVHLFLLTKSLVIFGRDSKSQSGKNLRLFLEMSSALRQAETSPTQSNVRTTM